MPRGGESRTQSRRVAPVSVALCTYNSARYIRPQLQSILEQTIPPREIVICDDGSADETLDLIREIAASHAGPTEMRIAETERVGGVLRNFERAVRACRSDFVALCDHDDVWTPRRLEVALATLKDVEGPALVFSDARLIDAESRPTGRTLFAAYEVTDSELAAVRSGDAFPVLTRRNIVTGATVLLNRALVTAGLPFPDYWLHDEWLAMLAAALGELRVIDEPLVDYRVHGANQIGVPPSTPLGKLRRFLHESSARFHGLRQRSVLLLERLQREGAAPPFLDHTQGKIDFETARRSYPSRFMPGRPVPILRQWRKGSYRTYTRLPRAEAWRDVFQRP